MKILCKLKAKYYKVPFKIKEFWSYSPPKICEEMKARGFEVGTIAYETKKGGMVCLFQNKKHEFIYKVTDRIKLKGSDFIYGTDTVFNVEFICAITKRD